MERETKMRVSRKAVPDDLIAEVGNRKKNSTLERKEKKIEFGTAVPS